MTVFLARPLTVRTAAHNLQGGTSSRSERRPTTKVTIRRLVQQTAKNGGPAAAEPALSHPTKIGIRAALGAAVLICCASSSEFTSSVFAQSTTSAPSRLRQPTLHRRAIRKRPPRFKAAL